MRIHVLIDLEWSARAGGHIKCWERFAESATRMPELDLTLHVAGQQPQRQELSENVRFMVHKPIFSTRNIPFLGHVPDHTDMASFHPQLAEVLSDAELVHTTDAFFNYAQTVEKLAATKKLRFTHSVHTDTVSYTALFTRSMLEKWGFIGEMLNEYADVPGRAAADMRKKLNRHMKAARAVLVSRDEDYAEAAKAVEATRIHGYRLGLDFKTFNPAKRDTKKLRERFSIPAEAMIILFVGRLDEGKNIYTLIDAVAAARAKNLPVFLLAAGVGPAAETIAEKLGSHAATPGTVAPNELAWMYASADYLAIPSEVETWSMAAAEALACGLPVMTSAKSGVVRFLDAGGGRKVDGNDVRAWEHALHTSFAGKNNPVLHQQAYHAAKRHFPSWDKALEEDFMPVWRKALNQ